MLRREPLISPLEGEMAGRPEGGVIGCTETTVLKSYDCT
jgi:hypothetical protein